jgi:hypothetical protein
MFGKVSRTQRGSAAFVAAWLVWGACSGTALAQSSGITHRLSHLEQCEFGAVHRERALDERVQALEVKTFGHKQPGSIAARLQALEHVVGNSASTAAAMPPLAPAMGSATTKTSTANAQENSGAPSHSAFTAPPSTVTSPSGNAPLLRGSATEYGATGQRLSPSMNPMTAPLTPGYQPNYASVQASDYGAGSQQTQLSGNAGQLSGNAGHLAGNAAQPASRPRLSPGVSNAVVNGTLSAVSRFTPGAGGVALKYLHCPLCRLLVH